jgi:hypothetical protein
MAADKLVWLINRLRRMTAEEVVWRITSMVKQTCDDIRIRTSTLPRPAQASLTGRAFGVPRPGREQIAALDLPVDPIERLLAKAEAIVADRLSFFDQQDRHLGSPPDWHRDFHNDVIATRGLSSGVDYRDKSKNGDCKHVWEPNRHHQLVVLGRAYQVSGDQRFADKIIALLCHWCDDNPYGYGMNWRSPMELGIRLVNWVWALDLIRDVEMSAPVERKISTALFLLCWDVERKLSQGSSANNHVIGEAAGLYVAGRYLPELIPAAWTVKAKRTLEAEIHHQYADDGASLEQAFSYQLFVLQLFTPAGLVGDWSGDHFSSAFWEQLARMYDYTIKVGSLGSPFPMYGDQDDGYVLDLGEHQHDPRQYRSLAGALFGTCSGTNDDDAPNTPQYPSEASMWLQPATHTVKTVPAPLRGMHVSEQAGIVLLNLTRADGQNLGLLFDCGPLGYGPLAAHGHADALQIVVFVNGEELLIDPGTYDYYSHPEWRDRLRGTPAHNTICIDDCNQSELQGRFMWGKRATARLLQATEEGEHIEICAQVDDLWKMPGGSICRTIRIDRTTLAVTIEDHMHNLAGHNAAFNLHFPESVDLDGPDANNELRFRHTAYAGSIEFASVDAVKETTTDISVRSLAYHMNEPMREICAQRHLQTGADTMTTVLRLDAQ